MELPLHSVVDPLDERRTRHDAMFQVLLANNVKLCRRFLINLTNRRIS